MGKLLKHLSAKPSHYNQEAATYDGFNEKNSEAINALLVKILKAYGVKSVCDMTCGTGSQVFWLDKCGFSVMGSDINAKMLKIAREKANSKNLDLKFRNGDVRNVRNGKFEAVLTIFNAIGHLTKKDFEIAIRNIHENLVENGLYIFDIFNLDYLLNGNQITSLTIDWQTIEGQTKNRIIQFSTIDKNGILASYTTACLLKENELIKMTRSSQTLQVYSAQEIKEMLQRNGFRILKQCAIDGTRLITEKSDRILTIAQKI